MGTISLGICLILLGQVMIPSRCELFTALVHMEGLLDLEVELLASLNSYITAEKERFATKEQPALMDLICVCTHLFKVAGIGEFLFTCLSSS